MRDDPIQSFAEQFHIPMPAAQRFATTIAEQCALLANRYEPEGAFTFEQLSAVETLGAEIGAAIIGKHALFRASCLTRAGHAWGQAVEPRGGGLAAAYLRVDAH